MYASPHFRTVGFTGRNLSPDGLDACGCSQRIKDNKQHLPLGMQAFWGIPFDCGERWVYADSGAITLSFTPVTARYLIFLHASEVPESQPGEDGLFSSYRGQTPLMVPVCDYVIRYEDGSSVTIPIRSRMEINNMHFRWGESAMLAKSHVRGRSMITATEAHYAGINAEDTWGETQCRVKAEGDRQVLQQWLYAFENPHPEKTITGMEIAKKDGNVFLFGVTAGDVEAHPLRYGRRQKAQFTMKSDAKDLLGLVDIDMGHIISVTPRSAYDNTAWENSPGMAPPERTDERFIVEFDAHEDAILYIGEERAAFPVRELAKDPEISIAPAERPVTLRVVDTSGKPVPVKVHAHGAACEYLPPRNRHRHPNISWFEDYSVDYSRDGHWCTYIDGTAQYLLPLGEVFFEVSKGFEIKPVRQRFEIGPDTEEIAITLERVIDWRSKGWVTADTHVHFLSPQTALFEGEAEGVNVVNLLASQWGELLTNMGDFTGAGETTAPDGEYMVRVGTENRQHIMGHISLLGYDGAMILPVTTGGPYESAQGDPMEITLTQWAAQCRAQNGLNIIPHFPYPRAENAAAIVSELIDAVEVTTVDAGMNPYYLSDWYRYLSCGYRVAAVGGTDKMGAWITIGAMRTYSKLNGPLTYQSWKESVMAGRTFATTGALVDMRVEGQDMGGTLNLSGGGTLNILWDVASATLPITSVELVMNGAVVDGTRFDGLIGEKSGGFTVNVKDSAWFALRVRCCRPGQPEIISAHTSAVFVIVDGKPLFNGPDAATILDQIEGATAYVKTLATRAQETQFKLALSALTGAHRALHNRMHASGDYHHHSPQDLHPGH